MPRQRSRSTSPEVRDRNTRDIIGRPGLAGMVRTGGRAPGRGRGQQSVVQNPLPDVSASGSAHLLVLSATGDAVEPGGDYVTFDTIVTRRGFDGVASASGGYWVHPISGVYLLAYEHSWDTYDGGGTIQLELDGMVPLEGVIAQGTAGQDGRGSIAYYASSGSVGRILVTHADASAQVCDAAVRIAITDPMEGDTDPNWTRILTGDVYDLVRDGTAWWVTEGFSGATVSKFDDDGTVLTSFEADLVLSRGITFAGGSTLWICGDDAASGGGSGNERIVSHQQDGTLGSVINTGGSADGNTGLTWDGTHLWLVETNAGTIEQWTTAGVMVSSYPVPADTYRDIAYFQGRLYALNTVEDTLDAFETDGTPVDSIDISGAVTGATGVFIDADGSLYIAKEGDGAWQWNRRLGTFA